MFRHAGLAVLGASLLDALRPRQLHAAAAAKTAAPAKIEPLPPLNRFPRMVHEYFVARVRAVEQA
ncbi:MAG: hypothetical protein FJ388_07940, partial [Verrucomicrobia bacterium]|nr:hypothetical protein [Verrucomicrobiota bacterium]